MRANPYRGEVAVDIGGERRLLRYSWTRMMALRAELGTDFPTKLNEAMVSLDMGVLAKALAIGLEEHWPAVTPETVMEASPPFAAAAVAVQEGLHLALNGPAGNTGAAVAQPNPPLGLLNRLRTALQAARMILSSPSRPHWLPA